MLQTLDSIFIYFEQTSEGRNKVNIHLEIEDSWTISTILNIPISILDKSSLIRTTINYILIQHYIYEN